MTRLYSKDTLEAVSIRIIYRSHLTTGYVNEWLHLKMYLFDFGSHQLLNAHTDENGWRGRQVVMMYFREINSRELSLSWKASSRSANQELPCILYNPEGSLSR